MTSPQMYLTVAEVAERLGVSERWLADECRAGRVAHVHIARKRRFTAEQVAALIAKFTVTPVAEQRLDATRERVLREFARRRPA